LPARTGGRIHRPSNWSKAESRRVDGSATSSETASARMAKARSSPSHRRDRKNWSGCWAGNQPCSGVEFSLGNVWQREITIANSAQHLGYLTSCATGGDLDLAADNQVCNPPHFAAARIPRGTSRNRKWCSLLPRSKGTTSFLQRRHIVQTVRERQRNPVDDTPTLKKGRK